MSLDQLRTFVAVVEEGSLRAAASRLHLTEPPLSRHITRLEDELGARLFERHPRGMTLRPEGERFLVHARAVLHAVARATAFLDDEPAARTAREGVPDSRRTLAAAPDGALSSSGAPARPAEDDRTHRAQRSSR